MCWQRLTSVWPVVLPGFFVAACVACSSSEPLLANAQTAPTEVFGGGLAGQTIDAKAWDEAVAQVKESTVLVRNAGCGFEATGSAVAVTPDELVTNHHVVEGARALSIVTTSGVRVAVQSWVVSTSDDLALLKLSEPLFDHPVKVATDPTVPGNLVVVMGYPLGGPFTVGRGRVIDLEPDPGTGQEMVQASVDILPGNSGGPLLDTHGLLVGIVRAIDLQNGSAEAIPAARVSDLITGKAIIPGQPCLGPS